MSSLGNAGRDLAEILEQARSQLEAVRRQQAHDEGADPRRDGVGVAADGMVRATMAPDGRLTELELDERTAMMSRQELQREILTAVNAAWAASRGADEAEAGVAAVDPAALSERLLAVQEQSFRSMNRITEGLLDVMRQIDRSTRR